MSSRHITVRAFAKINLTLRVLGARRDGYHELRTILQSVALHDTLTFRAAAGDLRIACDDPACPTDRTNLVWAAAEQVWRAGGRRGRPRNLIVDITKRIPVRAGLGGGSSDGAAAIRGLAALWHIDLARDRQQAIAARLGADVPYFLEGGTALGLERGDLLFPLMDPRAAWVTLVMPACGVSTKDAYEWWDTRAPVAGDRVAPPHAHLVNDLQGPVSLHFPEVARIARALRQSGAAQAAMSGSGSAVFGLFDSRIQADRAAGRLAGRGRRTLVTRTLNRARFQRLSNPGTQLC